MKPTQLLITLLVAALMLLLLGVLVGSTGFESGMLTAPDPAQQQILWDIRLPRSLGAWLAGALLGLAGAVAQGLFRNPLADPYLLGPSAGAGLGVAFALVALGLSPAAAAFSLKLGLTGAAFIGAMAAMMLTLVLARGVEQTLRLLLAGVIVGVVLGSGTTLLMLMKPDIMRAMQVFMLGTTGFLSWQSAELLGPVLLLTLLTAMGASRALDALTLGEATAHSLGVRLGLVRVTLIAVLALATGTAVAQTGLVAFVGLVAPHLVRSNCHGRHNALLLLSALTGGALLLAADILARGLIAPQELPVGVLTSLLGGGYLLMLMHRRRTGGSA
ncbi:MAG: iron ABC transporter permease [Burkholderiaceae bacterium]|nr:iron ABC transporter permease [Roseateles sp.]MBV8469093.1 iron ABC transporter permease [Burkholderiaceae bacterium]